MCRNSLVATIKFFHGHVLWLINIFSVTDLITVRRMILISSKKLMWSVGNRPFYGCLKVGGFDCVIEIHGDE